MSEKYLREAEGVTLPTDVFQRHFQTAVRDLLHSCLTVASDKPSLKQPDNTEGERMKVMLPRLRRADHPYDTLGVVIPIQGERYLGKGELQAKIQYSQALAYVASDSKTPTLEWLKEYRIYQNLNNYGVESSNLVLDYSLFRSGQLANNIPQEFNLTQINDIDEINMIGSDIYRAIKDS